MGGHRPKRVADLLQSELSFAFRKFIRDPRLAGFSITEVDLSPDLRNAKIYFTLLNRTYDREVDVALSKASGFLRRHIAEQTKLQYVPRLQFIFDETQLRASKIDELIHSVFPEGDDQPADPEAEDETKTD